MSGAVVGVGWAAYVWLLESTRITCQGVVNLNTPTPINPSNQPSARNPSKTQRKPSKPIPNPMQKPKRNPLESPPPPQKKTKKLPKPRRRLAEGPAAGREEVLRRLEVLAGPIPDLVDLPVQLEAFFCWAIFGLLSFLFGFVGCCCLFRFKVPQPPGTNRQRKEDIL